MRTVKIYKYVKKEGKAYSEKEYHHDAIFHSFGVDYDENENGPGNFSTAIVELASGEIKNVPVELVVFKKQTLPF